MNVMRTVREFERAGVATVKIEDQQQPKRCGHLEGKGIIAKEEMVRSYRRGVSYTVIRSL